MDFITANGRKVGPIGQGTWYLGETAHTFSLECSALKEGIEAGMNLLDTAEMYGDGAAEKLLGQAIRDYDRENLYLVSKVYPFNAGRRNIFKSCEASLRRIGTDYLDLYLMHWRGSIPLAETVDCMEELKSKGLIRSWGVSNLDKQDMIELFQVPQGSLCLTDQVLYHLGSRGVEYNLLPWLQQHKLPLMAYCPLAQGGALRQGLLSHPVIRTCAQAHNANSEQILLAFLLSRPGVLPIPRSSTVQHTLANSAAAQIHLTPQELADLDRAFPPPSRPTALDIV